MADPTPFEELHTRFTQYSRATITSDEPPISSTDQLDVIERFFTSAELYFNETAFRNTLTYKRREIIEGQIRSGLDRLDEITQARRDGNLADRATTIVGDLANAVEDIDIRFVEPFNTHLLEGKSDIAATVSGIRSSAKEVQRIEQETKDTLTKANLLVGYGAEAELFNHFQRLANGRSIKENDDALLANDDKPKIAIKWLVIVYLVLALSSGALLIGAAPDIRDWFFPVHSSSGKLVLDLKRLGVVTPFIILGALIAHIRVRAIRGGYEKAAAWWVIWAVVAVGITGIASLVLIRQLGDNPGWDSLVPRIVSLLAPAYFVRLCVQNYRANKHLAVMNVHRATVSRVVGAYAKNLSTERTEESLQLAALNLKGDVYLKAAELVFDPGETGFLTRGTGAGATDNVFDGLPRPH